MNKYVNPKDTKPTVDTRAHEAFERRLAMAERAKSRRTFAAKSNGEEDRMAGRPLNFTKGLPHDDFGLVNDSDYDSLRAALVEQMIDFPVNMDGASERRWESPLAGHYFTGLGPDPASVGMAPAPTLGSSELTAEMAMIYALALVRDLPFAAFDEPNSPIGHVFPDGHPKSGEVATLQDLVDELAKLAWFDPGATPVWYNGGFPTGHELRRRAAHWEGELGLTVKSVFRGSTPGAKMGPMLSQFMLLGTKIRDNAALSPTDGYIQDGAQRIDQRVSLAAKGLDFMETWPEWLAIQRGVNPMGQAGDFGGTGFIETPRDLATYVHFDQLYQAYLNASLILLGNGTPVDPGFPIEKRRGANCEGFATFGGPHVLSIMPEVASRALRAVRHQKFLVHRRARPEVLAARLTQAANGIDGPMDADTKTKLRNVLAELGHASQHYDAKPAVLLKWIAQMNGAATHAAADGEVEAELNYLLPMAFREGSPMHAAYGAGHATVAGACVTILKAFFDADATLSQGTAMDCFVVADQHGNLVDVADQSDYATATVAGELDKLAANVSIGRNMAGVHYYTDYYDSLRMGERVAVGMLEEMMLAYTEEVEMTLTGFDGEQISISTDGTGQVGSVSVAIRFPGTAADMPYDEWWTRNVSDFQHVS